MRRIRIGHHKKVGRPRQWRMRVGTVGGALDSGDLVRLLENQTGERGGVAAVYLEGRTLPRKVRALIDFAVDDFGNADVK
ncbi:hypothetical protein [Cognatishimia sp. F0-27]|uniref:hypothetical protein n=1 Tax=Cognatishimia sp. F0-27 TaxID=2816855 RepID=UPI001D0C457E|nr:hypothetical protein [Cognatishimia sp. F0-27]